MPHDDLKQRQQPSLISRLLSIEAALLLMGLVSLVYGLKNDVMMNTFFGIVIIPGVFLLYKVRRKDWQAHWAELEEAQRRRQEPKDEGR